MRFPFFPFVSINTPAADQPAPPRPTFKIAQDVTRTSIDRLAARKKELEASIANASAELAHTTGTLDALMAAQQSYREANTVATAQSNDGVNVTMSAKHLTVEELVAGGLLAAFEVPADNPVTTAKIADGALTPFTPSQLSA